MQQQQQRSPEGDKYGFGMKFQTHQSQFYQQMVDGNGVPMLSPTESSGSAASGGNSTFVGGGQQQYGTAAHDQIMRDIDVKLRSRPQPPPMATGGQQRQYGHSVSCDDQTAMRVKRWIESKSVPDVKEVRPVLNREIQLGFALKKAKASNDRSAPRF